MTSCGLLKAAETSLFMGLLLVFPPTPLSLGGGVPRRVLKNLLFICTEWLRRFVTAPLRTAAASLSWAAAAAYNLVGTVPSSASSIVYKSRRSWCIPSSSGKQSCPP